MATPEQMPIDVQADSSLIRRSAALGRPYWQIPALPEDDRIIGGVAAGIGREIGLDPLWVRLSFVLLFAAGGWGGLLYAALWGALAVADYTGHGPTAAPMPKGRSRGQRLLGLGLIVFGLLTASAALGWFDAGIVWSSAVLGIGVLTVRRQVSARTTNRRVGIRGYLEVLIGIAITGLGALFLTIAVGGGAGRDLSIVVIVLALLIVAGSSPWWWRVVQDLDRERQARVRADERAAVAAHLHDSVLQTLTLIQQADRNPQRMASLARRQERELRNWLDPKRVSREGQSVRGRLDEMASDIEDLYETTIEVVAVGDCLVDDDVDGALAATREAVVNAAKHSGAPRIDVYAEVTDEVLDIFVRDTGKGFDRDSVAPDRRGVRNSIEDRMERLGGSATIMSSAGEGTEVEISLPRAAGAPAADPECADPEGESEH